MSYFLIGCRDRGNTALQSLQRHTTLHRPVFVKVPLHFPDTKRILVWNQFCIQIFIEGLWGPMKIILHNFYWVHRRAKHKQRNQDSWFSIWTVRAMLRQKSTSRGLVTRSGHCGVIKKGFMDFLISDTWVSLPPLHFLSVGIQESYLRLNEL